MKFEEYDWDTVIEAKKNPFSINIKKILEYKDLILLFVKRDIAITYKQTILGPLWYLIQPICTTLMCIIVFQNIAQLSTGGIPPVLFYFAGTVLWTLFSKLIKGESRVFLNNRYIFEKVYFPRLTVPIAIFLGEMNRFIIQFILFLLLFFLSALHGYPCRITISWLLLPAVIIWISMQAIGLGLIVSSLTTKYRDLSKALSFFLSLYMYITPVVYPLSQVSEKYRLLFLINPLTQVMECFRKICFGVGNISLYSVTYSLVCTVAFFLIGIILFNKNEKVFVDVI